MVELPAFGRLARYGRALRSRRSNARELVLAVMLSLALVLGYRALGNGIGLWSRLHLWYGARQVWALQHFPARPVRDATSSGGDFRLEHSPFLSAVDEIGFHYHPLIDVTGAQFPGLDRSFKALDFFGFRNDFNAYFDPGDYLYIVMTGNSEAVGFTHPTATIAQALEEILRARTGRPYRVLNLAMDSATTANEINYFVNLAFNLHPEFVISHSFQPDMYYGRMEPPLFRKMGLFYHPFEPAWSKLVHAGNYDAKYFEEETAGQPSAQYVFDGFLLNLRRYRAIAGASGAKFIYGIQKFNVFHPQGPGSQAAWFDVQHMYETFTAWLKDHPHDFDVIDFNKLPGIEFGPNDPVHTTQASARRIAEIYADHILAEEGSR